MRRTAEPPPPPPPPAVYCLYTPPVARRRLHSAFISAVGVTRRAIVACGNIHSSRTFLVERFRVSFERFEQGSIFRRIRRIRQPDPAGSAPDVKLPDRLRVAAPAAPPCPFGYGGKVAWSERKKLVKRRSNKFRRRIWQGSNPWPPDLGWSASRARLSSWGLGPCIAKSTSYKPCHSSGATDRTSWTAQDT